jgi:hypothetical protein
MALRNEYRYGPLNCFFLVRISRRKKALVDIFSALFVTLGSAGQLPVAFTTCSVLDKYELLPRSIVSPANQNLHSPVRGTGVGHPQILLD